MHRNQHEPECVAQAECDNCESEDMKQTDRTFEPITPDDEMGSVKRELTCPDCGETGTVAITPNGLDVSGAIDYSNASWNDSDN